MAEIVNSNEDKIGLISGETAPKRSKRPKWGEYYLSYFQKSSELMKLYEKWARPSTFLTDFDYWTLLRNLLLARKETKQQALKDIRELEKDCPEANFGIFKVSEAEYFVYNRSVLWFLLETEPGILKKIVESFKEYVPKYFPEREEQPKEIERALLMALIQYNPLLRFEYCVKAGIPFRVGVEEGFWVDVLELFKEFFASTIKLPRNLFDNLYEQNKELFASQFEEEWKRAIQYQDIFYNFSIIPLFTPLDMVKYANLPRELRKPKIVSEMIDYVTLRIAPAPFPSLDRVDHKRLEFWGNVLLYLHAPLIKQIVNKVKKNSKTKENPTGLTPEQEKELRKQISLEFPKFASKYNYWYKWGDRTAFPRPIGTLTELSIDPYKLFNTEAERKVRWVRPSIFMKRRLEEKYLGKDYYSAVKIATGYSVAKRRLKDRPNEKKEILASVQEGSFSEQSLSQTIEVDGERYLTIEGLSQGLGVSSKTLRRWDKKGLLQFRWELRGRRKIRLFPESEVNEIIAYTSAWKRIAESAGVSDRYLRKIRSLPSYKQYFENKSLWEQRKVFLELVKSRSIMFPRKEVKSKR